MRNGQAGCVDDAVGARGDGGGEVLQHAGVEQADDVPGDEVSKPGDILGVDAERGEEGHLGEGAGVGRRVHKSMHCSGSRGRGRGGMKER